MKYKIDYTDSTWLFFTPFSFLNMGGTHYWTIMSKKHWWNKWSKVGYTYDNPEDAYIEYFKLKYNINIEKKIEFTHNKNKNKKVTCYLAFKFNNYSRYKYCVGYKPGNYAKYYHCCYSIDSYEDALMRLYNEIEIKKLIHKI